MKLILFLQKPIKLNLQKKKKEFSENIANLSKEFNKNIFHTSIKEGNGIVLLRKFLYNSLDVKVGQSF